MCFYNRVAKCQSKSQTSVTIRNCCFPCIKHLKNIVNKVPFAILRSISDGEGASMDYATFAEKAALQSILVVIDFIQRADELQA